MNSRKRNKLKAKRTPWHMTRFASNDFMLLKAQRMLSEAYIKVKEIKFNRVDFDNSFLSDKFLSGISQKKVTLTVYGSKTV